jgi:membrane-bound ClpP family serine protease
MTITSIVLLILIGLFLLIMEILFVPGMVLGFISVILMLIGVIFSFNEYGSTTGFMVLLGTGAATAAAVYWAFNSPIWKKMQVQSQIDGKANSAADGLVKPGDTGKTISRLNPMGKALINGLQVEVQVQEGFIDPDEDITVIKVQQNKIFVTLKS